MSRVPSSLLLALLAIPACSGGGSPDQVVAPGCTQVQSPSGQTTTLCLTSCNLGCTATGCAINQIAQNQPITLVFNQDLEPTSVNTASVSLRTTSGEEPVGQLLVNGSTITFLPQVLTVGAQSFFGFRAGETYQLTLPGGVGQINTLQSTSGDVLAEAYTCNLVISRGVIDLDGQPPSAELASPASSTGVDPATSIVLEFSELISHGPFLTASPQNQPVTVNVRRSRVGAGGAIECDPNFPLVQIIGSWQVEDDPVRQRSTAMFLPTQQVPGGVCVQIDVTSRVVDLAGTSSRGQRFIYDTTTGTAPPTLLSEAFDNSLNLDLEASSGDWGGGVATPGDIGWDGLHGEFDPSIGGTEVSPNVFEWDTDNTLIPRTRTLTNMDERITDGVFRFDRFEVPQGITVKFVGSKPAQIHVRGLVQIDGVVDLNGGSLGVHDGNALVGQAGGVGGAAGGAAGSGGGGDGADLADGMSPLARFSGADGEDATVPAGHAYAAQAVGTAGRGSQQFPASGLNMDVDLSQVLGSFSVQVAAGGGGGGFALVGEDGQVIMTPNNTPAEMGPAAPAGTQFNLLPLPMGESVLDHFLVGGAGGGGAASHPFLSSIQGITWHSGGGGGSGGGAIGFRVGRDMVVGLPGSILAAGGSTAGTSMGVSNNFGVPGGGGAGGSVVMQIGGTITQAGLIDVTGGTGGSTFGVPANWNMESAGGDASHGFIRLETFATPDPVALGTTMPAAGAEPSVHVASLTESDMVVGSRSLWRFTQQIFPPEFLRYEMDAIVDGLPMTFSDDPSVGILAGQGQAVQFLVQGAKLDPTGQVDPDNIEGWRRYVGRFAPPGEQVLTDDAVSAVRFLLLFDRNAGTSIEVDAVRIYFQPF